jgi:hypothetical protein
MKKLLAVVLNWEKKLEHATYQTREIFIKTVMARGEKTRSANVCIPILKVSGFGAIAEGSFQENFSMEANNAGDQLREYRRFVVCPADRPGR